MHEIMFMIIKMLNVSLEMLEWEVNDETHWKIMEGHLTFVIQIELMEFIMPQKLLNCISETHVFFLG